MKHLFLFFLFLISSTAFAQTECDSLDIISIQYSPFTDSVIVISVENNNESIIFDYPGFVLINTNGDTVAKETVNYFGIGQQSVHHLNVRSGVQNPLENFVGVLQLYTGFYSDLACEWTLNESLCTPNECDSIILAFENWGGALVLGDFAWSLLDSADTVIESGTFTMEAQGQHWEERLCLPKGMYSYTLIALGEPTGGGPTMTATAGSWYNSPTIQQYFAWFDNDSSTLEIPFYTNCIDSQSPSGIEETTTEAIDILRNGNLVTVKSERAMEQIELCAVDGKLIGAFAPNANLFGLPTNLPRGLYFVRVRIGEVWVTQKFVF
ncbi:MAG: T9SS type A sorting domain-containing protein [Flavobacteriales bacterium]|nr:T9SS type A sorting domain-containing protein [Flavobacteriales bacterium]